ncbi:MAG: hypothetical protein ABR902_10815 [Candidatus Korobacteraceae bacterium]
MDLAADVQVSERGLERKPPHAGRLLHAELRAFRFAVVIELVECSVNVPHELAGSGFVHVFHDRTQPDASIFQARNDIDLIRHLAREPAEIVDNNKVNNVLLGLAKGQHLFECWAIRSLGGLAFVPKDFENCPIVVGAEVNAP